MNADHILLTHRQLSLRLDPRLLRPQRRREQTPWHSPRWTREERSLLKGSKVGPKSLDGKQTVDSREEGVVGVSAGGSQEVLATSNTPRPTSVDRFEFEPPTSARTEDSLSIQSRLDQTRLAQALPRSHSRRSSHLYLLLPPCPPRLIPMPNRICSLIYRPRSKHQSLLDLLPHLLSSVSAFDRLHAGLCQMATTQTNPVCFHPLTSINRRSTRKSERHSPDRLEDFRGGPPRPLRLHHHGLHLSPRHSRRRTLQTGRKTSGTRHLMRALRAKEKGKIRVVPLWG